MPQVPAAMIRSARRARCRIPRPAAQPVRPQASRPSSTSISIAATSGRNIASVINAHAKHLAAFGAARVRLEGHTDERGSREYNIALGERRAQAVRRALLLQGAADSQLTTVSYGEERPAAEGSDEAAYEKNRRVEIVYGR